MSRCRVLIVGQQSRNSCVAGQRNSKMRQNKMLDRSPRRSVSNFRDRIGGGSVNIGVLSRGVQSDLMTNDHTRILAPYHLHVGALVCRRHNDRVHPDHLPATTFSSTTWQSPLGVRFAGASPCVLGSWTHSILAIVVNLGPNDGVLFGVRIWRHAI
jgi:hypothetical protein